MIANRQVRSELAIFNNQYFCFSFSEIGRLRKTLFFLLVSDFLPRPDTALRSHAIMLDYFLKTVSGPTRYRKYESRRNTFDVVVDTLCCMLNLIFSVKKKTFRICTER